MRDAMAIGKASLRPNWAPETSRYVRASLFASILALSDCDGALLTPPSCRSVLIKRLKINIAVSIELVTATAARMDTFATETCCTPSQHLIHSTRGVMMRQEALIEGAGGGLRPTMFFVLQIIATV